LLQNLEPPGKSAPQEAQVRVRRPPQLRQKVESGGFSCWQEGQRMAFGGASASLVTCDWLVAPREEGIATTPGDEEDLLQPVAVPIVAGHLQVG
jgi:hypothetical protein